MNISREEQILVGIRRIIRSVNLESKRLQKDFGLSIPQYLCLKEFLQADQYQLQAKSIKKALNLNASTVSGILQRIEKKNWIARLPKTGDKRVQYYVLTSGGYDLIQNIPPLLHHKLEEGLSKLSEAETNQMVNAINVIVELFGASQIDASPVIAFDEMHDTKGEE